jgi:hypothetical protein
MKYIALFLFLAGCSFITDADRRLAADSLAGASGCVYIQGSGGAAGGVIPPVPVTGGYGQGSLAMARSQRPDAKSHCGPDGASVE